MTFPNKENEVGFTQGFADNSIFYRHEDVSLPDGSSRNEWLIVGCYVDDLCVLYSHCDESSL